MRDDRRLGQVVKKIPSCATREYTEIKHCLFDYFVLLNNRVHVSHVVVRFSKTMHFT